MALDQKDSSAVTQADPTPAPEAPSAGQVRVKAANDFAEGFVKVAGFPEVELSSTPVSISQEHADALLFLRSVEAA